MLDLDTGYIRQYTFDTRPAAYRASDTVDLPAGESVTYTVTANIDPSATGNLANTASVATSISDPTPGDESATDTDARGPPVADLSIVKDDSVATYTPGGSVIYVVSVSNPGPSDVTGATVTDLVTALPQVASASWTCVAAGGATCTASGSGDINETVDLPAGSGVTYSLTVNLASAATEDLVNTADVTAPGGTTDPDLLNNSASDTDTLSASADLTVTKSDGVATYTPDALYTGGDRFAFTAIDADAAASDPATININVGAALDDKGKGQFTDSTDNTVSISLTGGGTAMPYYTPDGDLEALVVTDTTVKSSLKITVKGVKGAKTTVGNIDVTGSLKGIKAPGVKLLGDLTVTGLLGSLALGDVQAGHNIDIASAATVSPRAAAATTIPTARTALVPAVISAR